MKKYELFSLTYFLTRALFLGIGFSLIIGLSYQDSIISFIVGTLIGSLLILILNKLVKKGLNPSIKVILLIFSIILLIEGISFICLFASSFFLIRTPIYFIGLPIVLLLLYIIFNNKLSIYKLSTSLFPISFFLTISSLLVLLGYIDISNIKPLFITSNFNLIKSVFYYISLSVTPTLLLLNLNEYVDIKAYCLGSLTLIIKIIVIIGIMGPYLSSIYRFPEYIVLKEIKLLNFIEKIENIVSLSWVFDVFIYLSLSIKTIKDIIPKNKNIITSIILLITYLLSILCFNKYYTNMLSLYYIIPYIGFICFSLIIIILLLKKDRN